MQLLLIVSAMLSAVTGAIYGVRAPEVRSHQTAAVQAEAPCEEVVRTAQLEALIPRDAPRVAAVFAAASFDLPASLPLYADRLIE